MWLAFALGSALFSGTTIVLAKYGIKKVDSDLAVALRSVVILAFAWLIVLVTGSWASIGYVKWSALIFPLLSGITNALSWICYFKGLRASNVSQVSAVDKASITLTIVGGWLILGEPMTGAKVWSILLILSGALLMVEKEACRSDKSNDETGVSSTNANEKKRGRQKSWLFWSVLSALLAAATTLLSKAGVEKLDSDLGFAIRTGVMFVITWTVVICKRKVHDIAKISRRSMIFVGLSGLSTALAWLCYFRALAAPTAEVGIVQPIDKLSILVSVLLARIIFKEKLKSHASIGLAILTAGILLLIV